jgi:hypothetical protein
MIEDSVGLGYIVKVGTPIGENEGKVRAIKPSEIIIEETYVDLFGEESARSTSNHPWRRRNEEVEKERATLLMGANLADHTRYWCSVCCLLIGLGWIVGCTSTVNEQKGVMGEWKLQPLRVRSKKEDKSWRRQNKMCHKHRCFECRIYPSAKNRDKRSSS